MTADLWYPTIRQPKFGDTIPHIVYAYTINVQDIVDKALLCQEIKGETRGGLLLYKSERAGRNYSLSHRSDVVAFHKIVEHDFI